MFTANQRFISEDDTRDDYINLDLRLSSSRMAWDRAVEILRNRICGRYVDPMNELIQTDVNKNGFAAMAICCLLIDTLMQFREGYPQTPGGQCKREYSRFLKDQFDFIANTAMADRFYKDIRCGILHAAQTQNGSCLTFDSDYTVKTRVDGALMVDIRGMYNETCQYFDRYCNELKNTFNNELRENFIKKMDHITLKGAEGSEVIDNLWFALCENGYTRNSIESRRGTHRRDEFRVISEDTISLGYRIIKKEDILSALYYWPNSKAIRALQNGGLLYNILEQYRFFADEFKKERIA